jgi:hypothetical protein
MTDTPPVTIVAGWYSDPAGSGQLRWWSGIAWTEYVAPRPVAVSPTPVVNPYSAPALSLAPATPDIPLNPTRWTTGSSWLLALTPVIYLVVYLGALPTFARVDTLRGIVVTVGIAVFLPTVFAVIFAGVDWSRLSKLGYRVRPNPWWVLITPAAYLLSRSRKLRRVIGHGSAPLWTWIATWALSCAVAGIVTLLALPSISTAVDSQDFAKGLQDSLSTPAHAYAVSCPATASFSIGSRFQCTAVDDASRAVHVLTIAVVAGVHGAPMVRIQSVNPSLSG